jgi:APA family basic amino acid/polyamine antiporter
MLQWEFGLIRGQLPAIIAWENDELPIITLYALYIPIFINMMIHSKELHPVKRFVLPSLSIGACLFMIFCAFYAYKLQAFYYLFVFTAIMLVGLMFYRDKKGRTVIYKLFYK